jgi:hypothetical protein
LARVLRACRRAAIRTRRVFLLRRLLLSFRWRIDGELEAVVETCLDVGLYLMR